MSSDTSSDLFEVKNYFLLGNYQAAINEGSSLPSDSLQDADRVERDVYVYRSYIAQRKYQIVLDEINGSAPPTALQAVKLLASYLKHSEEGNATGTAAALSTLKGMLSDGVAATNSVLQLMAALIYLNNGQPEESMRCVYQSSNLEGLAMLIHIYLSISRVDQAEKELRNMHKIDDDATVTQLCTAWVNLALGGEKVQEALLTFQELCEKYGPTGMLLNGLGVCCLNRRRFADAEKYLLQALEKSPSDATTMANLACCYQHVGKPPEVITRQINQLKTTAPNSSWVKLYNKSEELFDQLAELKM